MTVLLIIFGLVILIGLILIIWLFISLKFSFLIVATDSSLQVNILQSISYILVLRFGAFLFVDTLDRLMNNNLAIFDLVLVLEIDLALEEISKEHKLRVQELTQHSNSILLYYKPSLQSSDLPWLFIICLPLTY